MKHLTKIFAVVALVAAVASCGGESTSAETVKPGDVAVQLFNAITSGDVQVVKDNIHFDSKVEKVVILPSAVIPLSLTKAVSAVIVSETIS